MCGERERVVESITSLVFTVVVGKNTLLAVLSPFSSLVLSTKTGAERINK